ncbi:MAG: hypothetical protein HYY09_08465 [Firmicutes bacterium]|nr:hypothetical protein [Bacillota bacterium]
MLKQLYESLGRYEPSFSSKLVATIDPKLPIWDANVLNNMQIKPPYYTSKNKIPQAMATYRNIQGQYEQFLNSEEGQLIVNTFNQNVKEHAKITDLKKVDFVFWQIRDEYSR